MQLVYVCLSYAYEHLVHRSPIKVYLSDPLIDFDKCLLHGPISINIPDNKATKYFANEGISTPEENGGGNMYTKTQGDGTAQKLYFLCF